MEGDICFDVSCIGSVSYRGIAASGSRLADSKNLGIGERGYERDRRAEFDRLGSIHQGVERRRWSRGRRGGCFLGIDGSCASCRSAGRAECARGMG
jgi:hypothetical protein